MINHVRFLTTKKIICEDDAPLVTDHPDFVVVDSDPEGTPCRDCLDLLVNANVKSPRGI